WREGTIAAELAWPELRGSSSSLAVPTIAALAQEPELREAKPAGVCWPRTPALEQSLAQLSQWPSTHRWVAQVRATLAELQAIPSLSDPLAGAAIAALEELGNEGVDAGEGAYDDREFQSAVLRTSYA